MMKQHESRVRFAPSPTGYLHIGGLRTALYNYLLARRYGGTFILRIEDTDRTRFVEGAADGLMDTLRWSGLHWDEGPDSGGPFAPYVQSERTDLYREYARLLLAQGHAYRCFCAPAELEEQRARQIEAKIPPMYDRRCRSIRSDEADSRESSGEPFTVRLKVPLTGETEFQDAVRGGIRVSNGVIDDQVLLKSDGFPTYHLANVVDDHLMRVSDVVRGEEWLPSTAKHLLLYRAFGWTPPNFAHLPLLLNADRSKLSKRQGDVAVEEYRAAGYLPEALINFVALLGWNIPGDREMFSLPELEKLFSLDRVGKAGAVFDIAKLRWFNGRYFRQLNAEQRLRLCLPHLRDAGVDTSDEKRIGAIIDAVGTHLQLPSDIVEQSGIFFADDVAPDSEEAREALRGEGAAAVLEAFAAGIRGAAEWHRSSIKEMIAAAQVSTGVKGKSLFMPIRVALTGRIHGPELPVVAELLGRAVCEMRIRAAMK